MNDLASSWCQRKSGLPTELSERIFSHRSMNERDCVVATTMPPGFSTRANSAIHAVARRSGRWENTE